MSSLTGTGIQPYTAARKAYLARYLQSLLPGLRYDVAYRWISAENGVRGNVLGVTYTDASGHQQLHTYSSQEAGLRAAVSLLKGNSRYHPFLKTISTNQSSHNQLLALAQSGWNTAYYMKHFFGISANSNKPKPKPDATLVSFSETDAIALLKSLGIDTTPTHRFSHDEAVKIADAYAKQTGIKPGTAIYNKIVSTWDGATVKTFLDTGNNPNLGIQVPDLNPLDALKLPDFINIENIGYAMAFIVGVPLALLGFYLLFGVKTGDEGGGITGAATTVAKMVK